MLRVIFNVLTRKLIGLQAKLDGVNGFTGRGGVEYTAWKNGAKKLDVVLRGVAGRSAEIYAEGIRTGRVKLSQGRAVIKLTTKKGSNLPELHEGAQIEIRQNGDVILSGTLAQN